MVTYEQAREIALSHMADKGFFNFCAEYENAFVFSKFDDFSIGGTSPCAVMKNTGEALHLASVLDEIGTETHNFKMLKDGTLEEVPLIDYLEE